jgi:Protein of unknown function (DUF3108)
MSLRLALTGAFFLSVSAHAAPPWQAELSNLQPSYLSELPPTVVNLHISWQGMLDAGALRIEFAPPTANKPGAYVVRATAASQGAAALLFPYESRFWSEMDSTTLRPRYFQGIEIDKKETVTTTVRHSATQVMCEELCKTTKTGKSNVTEHSFTYAPVYDIFSAMLLIRRQKLEPGDHYNLVIHPFDTPYLLRVQVLARELHRERDAIRLSVGLQKIDRKSLELLPYKKLKKEATLWLRDDDTRLPIELRAAAFIGEIRAVISPTHP